MDKKMKALVSILTFAIIITFSQAETLLTQPQQAPESFNPSETQQKNLSQNNLGGSCTYQVTITTSCSSPKHTRDRISLAFGDKYGYEVYVSRLDDPSSGTFNRCSKDTFKIRGPCTYQICFLYLYRSGRDGWKPGKVTVSGTYSKAVSFYYGKSIPNRVWYGFDKCESYSSLSSASA